MPLFRTQSDFNKMNQVEEERKRTALINELLAKMLSGQEEKGNIPAGTTGRIKTDPSTGRFIMPQEPAGQFVEGEINPDDRLRPQSIPMRNMGLNFGDEAGINKPVLAYNAEKGKYESIENSAGVPKGRIIGKEDNKLYQQPDGSFGTGKPFSPKASTEKQTPEEKRLDDVAMETWKNRDLAKTDEENEQVRVAGLHLGLVETKVPGKKAEHWWQSDTPDKTTWGFPESTGGQPKTGAVTRIPTPTGTGGLVSFTDSQGVRHRIPAENMPTARKRDPGLKLD